jgi:hypothetical protein
MVEWGRVTGAELIPSLVGGYTETVLSKLKIWKRFLKPNLETLPSFTTHATVHNLFNLGRHLVRAEHYRDLNEGAFAEWGRVVG